ncbi:hypothetical protein GIB67_026972 [Kingdonia uniflora]|uniref:F-box protein n=1 Tax=Kingdonia uniflora TaxID=39325 RepID=A0A7J7P1D1_9MAGN|nr:hypothetical protein GIB67_026972 [Kingdonia uniflora]
MAASNLICSSSSSCLHRYNQKTVKATLQTPKIRISLPNLPTRNLLVEEQNFRNGFNTITTTTSTTPRDEEGRSDSKAIAELYAVLEAVSDRIEMHANVAAQRNNWNNLLLNSINTITIAAATMVGLASSTGAFGESLLALKLSSTLLYSSATGMLLVMNKIQPSQLAEEQRNATRLFKQLQTQIQTTLALGTPTRIDVKDAMEKVLALDKAYPLPLLGGVMLEKFPENVKPAVWWPKQQRLQKQYGTNSGQNGWSDKLEEEMTNIVAVLKSKDMEDYVRLGKLAVKINKAFAITGPLLTGVAAIGSAFVGTPSHGSEAVVLGVVAGALATVVNTMEHGGQVGMVVEMYRSCAGSFLQLQESIEATLREKELGRRENGELFERKVALKLGRSLSELRNLAETSSLKITNNSEEFASKLF